MTVGLFTVCVDAVPMDINIIVTLVLICLGRKRKSTKVGRWSWIYDCQVRPQGKRLYSSFAPKKDILRL